MDPQTVAAIIAFAGLLLTQALMHRRWTREQDVKREAIIEKQAAIRRDEQAEILDRMAEQNNAVVENALRIVEVHREDAEKARLLALETAQAHSECRQEVAHLAGQVAELRARVSETERTQGRETLVSQRHQDLKHEAMTALAVSEGITALAVSCAKGCTCHSFDAMSDLLSGYRPRMDELSMKNRLSLDEWLSRKENP